MASFQSVSTAAFSSLVWEIEQNATNVFGPSPFDGPPPPDDTPVPPPPTVDPPTPIDIAPGPGRLARWIDRFRDRVAPRLIGEINTETIQLVFRALSPDQGSDNPLDDRYSETVQEINAVISGPSAEDLESGVLAVSDFKVLVPAKDISIGLSERHAFRFEGHTFDITNIKPIPTRPRPVAYVCMTRRATR